MKNAIKTQVVKAILEEDAVFGQKLVRVLQKFASGVQDDEKKEYKSLDEYLKFRRRDAADE